MGVRGPLQALVCRAAVAAAITRGWRWIAAAIVAWVAGGSTLVFGTGAIERSDT